MMRSVATVALAVLLGGRGTAAETELRFIGCPIYRDTNLGRKSGCWLVDDPASGTRYDVSKSPGKPDWSYSILVEGRVSASQDNACGGIVLDPARVSIVDKTCPRVVFPAGDFSGRAYALPKRRLRPLYVVRTPAARPYTVRSFTIGFEFNRDFVTYELSDFYLEEATSYVLDVSPARVSVVGYADTRGSQVSGLRVSELAELAERRARRVAQWLTMRGVPADQIHLSWRTDPAPSPAEVFDGLVQPSLRRADITVTPIPATAVR